MFARQASHRSSEHLFDYTAKLLASSGLGDYPEAVSWLERADSIPLASEEYREGIKVLSKVSR